MSISRRALLGLGSATAATALAGFAGGTRALAQSDEYTLVRDGYVLTLDPQLGELSRGNVLIQGDEIVDVGENLSLPGPGSEINAEHMLVAPGLVDNHRHLWVSLLRGFSADHSFDDYFGQVLLNVSPQLTANDVYLGCLLGAYEALNSGVTTVLDWNHGTNSHEHATSAVAALQEAGIRALFGYSSPAADSSRADAPPTVADLDSLASQVASDPLVGLAVATRNPESADTAGLQRIADDIGEARRLGVPITLHTGFGSGRSAPQWLSDQGLLGSDVTLVHGNSFTASELDLVANAGSFVSTSPDTELQMGLGAPALRDMRAANVQSTVSVDVVAAAAGDLQAQLRLLLQTQRMRDHASGNGDPMLQWESTVPYVTSNAAASLGLGDQIGRLAPGRKADMVLIDRADPNLSPAATATTAALTAPTSAIDTVLVGGNTVKENGQMVVGDLRWLRSSVADVRTRLLSEA